MALIEASPPDELRVILCLKFDRRAPFDAVARFKQSLIDCACVVQAVEAEGAFDCLFEAGLPDFAAYHALLDNYAEELATLVQRQEASFVCRRFRRAVGGDRAIWVPCQDGRRRVDCGTIRLVRAEGDYVRLYCGAQTWLLHDTMHHLREMLDPAAFITLHRSAIANASFIERLTHRRHYWVAVMADGTEQRIAKSHVMAVRAELRTDSSMHQDASARRRQSSEISAPPMEEAMQAAAIRATFP